MDSALDCNWRASPNFGPRAGVGAPNMLILHYTGMASGVHALDWLVNPEAQVSSHYLVDEDGEITQMVREKNRAWHAGSSSWEGASDINSRSIGIEIQNPGPEAGEVCFSDIQMSAVEALCLDILSRHEIAPRHILAHSDIAPGRKIDPGETFDWHGLYGQGIGHWVAPAPVVQSSVLELGAQGDEVEDLQNRLKTYGYGLKVTRLYDQATEQVVSAFQRHFRQVQVDGKADFSTQTTLERLIAAL